jgi:hypothetical protein
MIPVPVSDPQFDEPAFLCSKNRFDIGPDVTRRIDQHSLAACGICEEVGIRLDRSGWQDVKFHVRQIDVLSAFAQLPICPQLSFALA